MASALLIGKDHRLQYVNHLCDIGHLHTIGVFVEHIQRKSCNESIAEGILLIEVTGNRARLLIPPCAPLINEQAYLVIRVCLIHDGFMLLDDFFDLQTLTKRPVILIVIKGDR